MRAVFRTADDLILMWKAVPVLIRWPRLILGTSCLFYGPLFILKLLFEEWSVYTAMLGGTAMLLGLFCSLLSDTRRANLPRISYTAILVYQVCGFLAFIPQAQVFDRL